MGSKADITSPTRRRRLALHVLASGSRGNAAIVQDRLTRASFVIDCGICKRDFLSRAVDLGQSPDNLHALFITHEHSDHTKGLGVVLRGIKRRVGPLPLYASRRMRDASAAVQEVIDEELVDFRPLEAGGNYVVWPFVISVFATSHDAAESFGFRIATLAESAPLASPGVLPDATDDDLGYVTDTGILSAEALEGLKGVRLLAIECNHDEAMLAKGPYPKMLKRRIASDRGHLSNDQAATALRMLAHPGLEHVVAMHISQNNNTYSIATEALREALESIGSEAIVHAAFQDRAITVC